MMRNYSFYHNASNSLHSKTNNISKVSNIFSSADLNVDKTASTQEGTTSKIHSSSYENIFSHSHCGIDQLIKAIHSDPEYISLRPWSSVDQKNKTIHFAGLDHNLLRDAFRGRRIVILGDSTLRNLNQWLHKLLSTRNETSLDTLSSMNLSEANNFITSQVWESCSLSGGDKHLECRGMSIAPKTNLYDGTMVRFIRGPPTVPVSVDVCVNFTDHFVSVKAFQPDTIIANMGLWFLHFQTLHRTVGSCVAETWINYEDWLESLVTVAEQSGAKVLVFKTTNFICVEKYVGAFVEANRLYSDLDNAILKACSDDIRAGASAMTSDIDIENYCMNGTFNDSGSRYLNERLYRFVEKKQHDSTSRVKLRVLNDHDIQSCKYTPVGNARHYHEMNLARIRLLGNILTCDEARA
ncbi:hypothetical protein ACHAXS_008328 [Conticribra weissflogii]